jgi:hypothetical protein
MNILEEEAKIKIMKKNNNNRNKYRNNLFICRIIKNLETIQMNLKLELLIQ